MKYRVSVVLSVALFIFGGCNDGSKSIDTTPKETAAATKNVQGKDFNYKITVANSASTRTENAQTAKNPQLMMTSTAIPAENIAPVCKISTNETHITTGGGIEFIGSGSYDPDGSIVAYRWEDMDGNVLSESADFSRGFPYAATYEKTLYVTDDKGAVSHCSVQIVVTPKAHKPLSVSIIHVNDTHSHLASETMSLYFNGHKTYTPIGGFPRLASKIKALQESEKNPITLHAGDVIQGTLYYTLFKGAPDALMMDQIKWDAVTLGNHEFDDGDEGLKFLLDGFANIDVISANVVPKPGSLLACMWKPYKVIEREGEKIGLIGLDIVQKTKVSSSPGDDIMFTDELLTAQEYADDLTAQGINKIILVSHNGMDRDLDFASKLRNVDVIIDGDSHSLLGDFSNVGLKSNYATYPQEVSVNGEKTCVTSAWQYAYGVGDLRVDFDKAGKVTACKGQTTLILGDKFLQKNADGKKVEVNATEKAAIMQVINSTPQLEIVPEDPDVLAKLKVYSDQIDAKKNEVIGQSAELLAHNRIPGQTYNGVNLPLGSDIAPLVAKSFYLKSKRADLCIQNAGGVRTSIDQGDITYGEAYAMLPFSNTLFEIDMKGSEIKQVLEDAIINFKDNGGSTGSFPYAYGIRYDVDLTQPANSRISNIEVMDRETHAFSPIENDKTYVVVTNNYIAAGRDGYTTFKTVQEHGARAVDTYYDYAMSFVDMVKALQADGKELTKLPPEEHPIKSMKQ